MYEPTIILRNPDIKAINYLLNNFKNLENNNSRFFVINDYYKDYKNKYEIFKNLFFIKDIHLNKKGNKLVAEEILNKINF